MPVFTREEIEELYKPFPLDAHSVREGNRSKSGKIQWFVYLDRAAVQRRLDELFPGEWGLTVVSEQYTDSFATCTLSMTIRGIERTCNGGQSLKYQSDTMDEDKIKGAWTEAFRRTASVWGIGLYLYAGDAIWTDGYPDKDWDAQRQRQKEAFDKFAKQHAALPGAKAPNPYAKKPATNSTDDEWTKVSAGKFAELCKSKGLDPLVVLSVSKWDDWTGTYSEAVAKLPKAA